MVDTVKSPAELTECNLSRASVSKADNTLLTNPIHCINCRLAPPESKLLIIVGHYSLCQYFPVSLISTRGVLHWPARSLDLVGLAQLKNNICQAIANIPVDLLDKVERNFRMELEESFLSSQAPSFRATVEFVAERISSSCIKHICSNVIAPCKEEASTLCNKQKEENKKLSKKEVQTQVEEACQTTLARIHTALDDHCGPQVGQALRVLLGPDATDPAILSSAHNICGRRCRERIINWLNSHIKLSNIFTKIFNGLDTKQNGEQTTGRKDVEHKDLAMSPPDLLIELQERLCQCIENRNLSVSEEQVLDLIDKVMETIKHRSDLVPRAEQTLHSITVDYCIVLMAHCPGVLTTEVLHRLCSLWLTFVPQSTPLERVLSSRNVLLLCQSGPQVAQASWRQLSRLLVLLLKEELLAPKQLEAQFVALFRKDWPPMVHSLMGTCLSSMLELIRQDPKCNKNPKFVLMLEWANEMMNELARDDICEDS
ncbi:negative regulation of DNA replication [Homalodisca vitripennis]|nr:negative regulation of DNA replication [Homalodisca vitripennis]